MVDVQIDLDAAIGSGIASCVHQEDRADRAEANIASMEQTP